MVHSFSAHLKGKEYYFVTDVESGSLHNVDYVAFLCIKNHYGQSLSEKEQEDFSKLSPDTISEVEEEISELEKEGVLNTPCTITSDVYEKKADHVKALCLHICHDCNLRCEYCFAKEGTYNTPRDYMSLEVGKKSIDFLISESKNIKNLEVDFFGGEPLLNLDVVKGIVEYAKARAKECGKIFTFTMTTNCLMLNDDTRQWLNEEMDNVVLSIDGRKSIHDRVRKTANGVSAYDSILNNALKMAKMRNGKRYYARGTYTAYNIDFSKDVIELAEKGFDQISVEPVVLPEDSPMALKMSDVAGLCDEYDKVADALIDFSGTEKGFNFFHFMLDLDHGPCINKRLHGCGAGLDYLAVAPTGEIYPCHRFAGNSEYVLGTVYDGIERQDIRDRFAANNLLKKAHCIECPSKYYCGGGCAANALEFCGSLEGQYEMGCILQRKRLECALAIEGVKRI